MDFAYSDKVKALQSKLERFMAEHIYPNERRFHEEVEANRAKGNPWVPTKLIEELKPKARAEGLWNLFLPRSQRAPEGLSNLEYAPLCEIMGRVHWAPEVFNCSAPDTGNMETLERYGSEEQKKTVARSAARRDDPLGLPHDRARRGLLGRHQHPVPHRAARAATT